MRSSLLLAHLPRVVSRATVPALLLSLASVTAIASAQVPQLRMGPVEPAPVVEEEAPPADPESTPESEPAPEAPQPEEEVAEELEPAPSARPPVTAEAAGEPVLTLEGVSEAQADEAAPEDWTQPVPVLTLHGYMRVRGEMQDTFWLGRGTDIRAQGTTGVDPDPFSRFRSTERAGCADDDATTFCDSSIDTLAYGNMRLRLSPELNISDDVRVHATFDAFDNVAAGTGSATFYDPAAGRTYASTLNASSVLVRRAWAEVRNRNLGELRFGRMPAHWGLGMVQNAGNRIDDDLSTEVDRVMVITKLVGLYLSASYDFTGEGATRPGPSGLTLDASQRDDVDQFSFSVSHRLSPEEQADALSRGDITYQAGGMFNYRTQDLAPRSETLNLADPPVGSARDEREDLTRVDASTYNFDAWGQLKWRGLRVEAEAALVVGSVLAANTDGQQKMNLLQFGSTLETELRLMDDKLGIYFNTGIATGDPDSDGLSSGSNFVRQDNNDRTISTFRFHPTYRVDLILWRNLMQQVTGAYYFKPGISYDFARDPFGQLLGARVDAIWSRAIFTGQTWGGDPNLGVEINASIYWRGEDGPELDDGFHAIVQYGILFPMQGLGYRSSVDLSGAGNVKNAGDLETAQTLRLILGVVY